MSFDFHQDHILLFHFDHTTLNINIEFSKQLRGEQLFEDFIQLFFFFFNLITVNVEPENILLRT